MPLPTSAPPGPCRPPPSSSPHPPESNPSSNRLLQPPRTILYPPVPVPVVTFSNLDINHVGVRFDGGGGINFDAYEDIPIEMSGSDVPLLAGTFTEIDLEEALCRNVGRCGYVRPTSVQRHRYRSQDGISWPAPRPGPGAVCFSIHQQHSQESVAIFAAWGIPRNPPGRAHLSPTRKLASQIHVEAKKFAFQRGVKVVAYGGASMYYQIPDLRRFHGNSFQGPIPSSISNLIKLSELRIGDITNGSSSLGFISSSFYRILRNSKIFDTIPANFTPYTNLQKLDLSFNNITGALPESLFNSSSVTSLFLGNNSLSGTLPTQKSQSLTTINN